MVLDRKQAKVDSKRTVESKKKTSVIIKENLKGKKNTSTSSSSVCIASETCIGVTDS